MANIFISYRRNDSPYVTGRIRERLEAKFGRESVFTDVDSIPLGIDFTSYIDARVGRCECLLAIIGPRWMEATDASGQRRLEDPRDFVRTEIEAALARDVPVIPVLVDGASMPVPDRLPESLRPLSLRNGLPVRPDPDFDNDIVRLLSGISIVAPANARPLARLRRSLSARKTFAYLCGFVILAAGIWLSMGNRTTVGPLTEPARPARNQSDPDWRTAAAEVRIINGVEYYEVDFGQGLTSKSVCALVRKVPGKFAADHKVCHAFYPSASVKTALSGDRAVVYCSGREEGICSAYQNACIVCPKCTAGVGSDEWGGRLYGKLFTTCVAPG